MSFEKKLLPYYLFNNHTVCVIGGSKVKVEAIN